MRCFLALDIPDEAKIKINRVGEQMSIFGIKSAKPENLHYTIKFLGDISEETVNEVKMKVREVVSGFQPFTLNIKNIGVFPNLSNIRIIWLGGPELYQLQKAIDEGFSGLFKKEREIVPHLTIARVRFLENKEKLVNFLEENKEVNIGSFEVNEIKLKKSVLTSSGPLYENQEVFQLLPIK